MFKRIAACLLAVLLFQGGGAATVQQQEVKRSFPPPPAPALKALKATVGKPFTAGYVFIDGKYVKPPYKVERYGTVIRINGYQVTGEIVPWNAFAKTQPGARRKAAPAEPETAVEPEAEDDSSPKPVAGSAAEEEGSDEDEDSVLDELFCDDREPEPETEPGDTASATGKSGGKPARAKPKRRAEVYEFDGPFELNASAAELLARINARRTQIDKDLRSGGYVCFGSRYVGARGDAKLAKDLLDRLPGIMKRCSDHAEFANAMRQAGFVYLPKGLVDDFFRNRFDYLLLDSRKKDDAERKQWQTLMNK